MLKIDLKKELKGLYNASEKRPKILDVPELSYLMVDGKGDPNTSKDFSDAMEVMYPLSYTIKFMSKEELNKDFVVMPLEAVWWADDMMAFVRLEKDLWKWTVMQMQPDFVTKQMVERAMEDVKKKKGLAYLDLVRLERYDEGRCAQIMHIGPYSDEGPTIEKLHEFIEDEGYNMNGKHREIYMSDPRRVPPEKYRTIIRQPIRKI